MFTNLTTQTQNNFFFVECWRKKKLNTFCTCFHHSIKRGNDDDAGDEVDEDVDDVK